MASRTGCEIGRRGGDDAQHLGRGRLLLQRLGLRALELGVALLQLLEQPGVLDGDDGLVGERLQQRDLADRVNGRTSSRGRRARRVPRHRQERHVTACDRRLRLPIASGYSGVRPPLGPNVGDRGWCAARGIDSPDCSPIASADLGALVARSHAAVCSPTAATREVIVAVDSARLCTVRCRTSRTALSATASRTGWSSVGEAAIDAQDLGGGGLLLQRLSDARSACRRSSRSAASRHGPAEAPPPAARSSRRDRPPSRPPRPPCPAARRRQDSMRPQRRPVTLVTVGHVLGEARQPRMCHRPLQPP